MSAMSNVIDLAAARERRAFERDAAVSVIAQLPADVAMQLLSESGWRVSDGPLGGCWTAPDGNVIYGIDEALEVALVGNTQA
jgi:hypothetical protein